MLDELPQGASGKVDRNALPWPPPAGGAAQRGADLSGTAGWLAERWADQLGPVEITPDSDFFELGGSSLAAAKLTSALRERFPAVAVADVYNHRRLGQLSARLDQLGSADRQAPADARAREPALGRDPGSPARSRCSRSPLPNGCWASSPSIASLTSARRSAGLG